MATLQDCIAWYGQDRGVAIHEHWQCVLDRINKSPTVIEIPQRDKVMEARLLFHGMTEDERRAFRYWLGCE